MADFVNDVFAPVLLHPLVAKDGGDFFALARQLDLAVAVVDVYRQLVHLHAALVGDGERQQAAIEFERFAFEDEGVNGGHQNSLVISCSSGDNRPNGVWRPS